MGGSPCRDEDAASRLFSREPMPTGLAERRARERGDGALVRGLRSGDPEAGLDLAPGDTRPLLGHGRVWAASSSASSRASTVCSYASGLMRTATGLPRLERSTASSCALLTALTRSARASVRGMVSMDEERTVRRLSRADTEEAHRWEAAVEGPRPRARPHARGRRHRRFAPLGLAAVRVKPSARPDTASAVSSYRHPPLTP